MTLALIRDDAVAEQRDIALEDVPEHKRHLWKPIEGDEPSVDLRTHQKTGPVLVIEPTRVLRQWTVTPRDLAVVKANFSRLVDETAETFRAQYVTPGSGQAMTYQEKFAQAEAIDAMGEQAANALTEAERIAQFPTLAASVGIEAQSLWDCAQLVITKYQEWAALSYQIERTRLSGKAAIAAAGDVTAAAAAYDAVAFP